MQVCTFPSTEKGGRGWALDQADGLPSKSTSDEIVLGSGFQLLLIACAGRAEAQPRSSDGVLMERGGEVSMK